MENKEKSKGQLIKDLNFFKKIGIKQLEKLGVRYKKVDEKLMASEGQLHKVLATIREGVTFSDKTGYFYVYNSAMEKLTGYSLEEANACSDFISFIYPDPKDRQMTLQGIAELLEKRTNREIETIITTKSGQLKNVRISSSLISHEGHDLFLSVYFDITEHKRAENRLLVLNKTFLEFEANPDRNISRLTAVLGESFGATCALYSRLEKGMLRVVGQWNMPVDFSPVDKPDGHICYDVIRRGEKIAIIQNLQESPYVQTDPNISRYQLRTYIGRAVRRGENYIGSLCSVFQRDFIPSKDDIKVLEIVASAIEVEEKRKQAEEALQEAYTKLKETQSQLIQAEKMEAIGRLASGIAHEVRNPLGIILQGVNYLEENVYSEQKDIFEMIQTIKNNIKRADNIVRTLVEFSRAGELNLKAEDINSILENSLVLVRHKINPANIEIFKELALDLPKVLIDNNKIEQVFINLLLNAVEAMSGGGKLFIRSYLIQLNDSKSDAAGRNRNYFKLMEKAVVVQIEDTGSGISKESLRKVFDPFFTTKGSKDGVGLGLAVTKNIIDMHKGIIDIESEAGKGTKASIILKIA